MSNINKIKVSGQTYNIEDVNASKTVELTQAQYNALTVKDPNTFYVITDAQGADLSNYYTKSETSGATEISTALNAKVDESTYIEYTESIQYALYEKVSYYDYNQFTGTTSGEITDISDSLNNKVDTSTYNTYTAATATAIGNKLATSDFNTYTAATNSRLSEDEEVTAAGLNALNDNFGGLKLVKLSQAEYNALATKDSSTLYIIVN